jgi:hypothetical protein
MLSCWKQILQSGEWPNQFVLYLQPQGLVLWVHPNHDVNIKPWVSWSISADFYETHIERSETLPDFLKVFWIPSITTIVKSMVWPNHWPGRPQAILIICKSSSRIMPSGGADDLDFTKGKRGTSVIYLHIKIYVIGTLYSSKSPVVSVFSPAAGKKRPV